MDKIKILYVEDELFLGRIVKESLESRGYDVVLVSDGAKVLPTFATYHPDICVLDVMLPHQNGFDLAPAILAEQPLFPILFLTAKAQPEDVVKGFSVGASDYLRKPFSMEELIVRIENLLKMKNSRNWENATANKEIAIGKFTFLPGKYELCFENTARKLSHREAELLKILCAFRGQTVTRKRILLDVWGDDSFFNSRTLDVYINRLREYFKQDASVEIITMKGIGYHCVF